MASKYKAEISGFQSELLGDLYTIKSPQYASVEEAEYIKSLFDDMERAIVSEDGIDSETGMSYLEYIDVRSFAQKYVIEELCKNNGAGATSSFFISRMIKSVLRFLRGLYGIMIRLMLSCRDLTVHREIYVI